METIFDQNTQVLIKPRQFKNTLAAVAMHNRLNTWRAGMAEVVFLHRKIKCSRGTAEH